MYTDQKPWVVDDMLQCVWPWILRGGEDGEMLRRAFERKNADAVWLMERVNPGDVPLLDGKDGYFVSVKYQDTLEI
jgi:hypothetical protein